MAPTTFTHEDVSKHSTASSLYMIIDEKVYDVTKFIDEVCNSPSSLCCYPKSPFLSSAAHRIYFIPLVVFLIPLIFLAVSSCTLAPFHRMLPLPPSCSGPAVLPRTQETQTQTVPSAFDHRHHLQPALLPSSYITRLKRLRVNGLKRCTRLRAIETVHTTAGETSTRSQLC